MDDNRETRVAIVSGGLGDIGRAIADAFARRGIDVALGDIPPPAAAEAAIAELSRHGTRIAYHQVDVSDAGAVQRWVDAVERSLGVPTLAVANAAQVTRADFRAITAEQWAREMRVNLDGAFYLAHSAALRMLANGRRGRIVFLGSWAADHPHRAIPAYCVAKAGLRMLCQCLALEMAPHGILVNEVAPGIVDAGLSGRIMRQDPAIREKVLGLVPTGSLLSADDVARAVAWACEPETNQMVGSVIVLDGGMSLLPPGN